MAWDGYRCAATVTVCRQSNWPGPLAARGGRPGPLCGRASAHRPGPVGDSGPSCGAVAGHPVERRGLAVYDRTMELIQLLTKLKFQHLPASGSGV